MMISSSRSKYLLMTSGLLAAALAYDKGSTRCNVSSDCLARNESHQPLVISTLGQEHSRSVGQMPWHSWISHRQLRHSQWGSQQDLPLPFYLLAPLLVFRATVAVTLSCSVDLGTPLPQVPSACPHCHNHCMLGGDLSEMAHSEVP